MKGYDIKFIDELKQKNDIVDVVSRYVQLEQRGTNFWGRCPFHHEKTASFSVNSAEQFYYCFGCHKSGDVISFIMDIESLDFYDAVKFLAERAQMQLPEMRYDDEKIKEQKRTRERLLSLLRDTALFYLSNLKGQKGTEYYEYALRRKLTDQTIVKFGIGASLDFNSLPQYLLNKGYTKEEMVLSGAVGEKDGRCFDWLGKRLIIPVIDQFNNVVAFVGRRIDGGKEQKYINTKETQVFQKGKTFFNLNNLKKIKNQKGLDSVILVEGHLDVVSLSQAGFGNVVASMGTALTKDQARILKRYTDKVFISYDGDFAGQKASIRGLEILSDEGLDVKVVNLPDGMDPDDAVKTLGQEGYRDLLNQAMPLIDFKLSILKNTFDLNSVDGKRKYVSNAIKVIRESPSPAEQEDLLRTVHQLTGLTFESLKRELYSESPKPKAENIIVNQSADILGDKTVRAGRFVLFSYLFSKPWSTQLDIESIEFILPVHKEIQQYIISKKKENMRPQFTDLYEIISQENAEELAQIAKEEAEENKKYDQAVSFFSCVQTLKKEVINKKVKILSDMCMKETDVEKRKLLLIELNKLIKEKNN